MDFEDCVKHTDAGQYTRSDGPQPSRELKVSTGRQTGFSLCVIFAFLHSKPKINKKCQVTHSWIQLTWPLSFLLCAFPGEEKRQ